MNNTPDDYEGSGEFIADHAGFTEKAGAFNMDVVVVSQEYDGRHQFQPRTSMRPRVEICYCTEEDAAEGRNVKWARAAGWTIDTLCMSVLMDTCKISPVLSTLKYVTAVRCKALPLLGSVRVRRITPNCTAHLKCTGMPRWVGFCWHCVREAWW